MKLKLLLFLSVFYVVSQTLQGQNVKKEEPPISPVTSLQSQLLNEQVTELIANRTINYAGIPSGGLATVEDFFEEDLDALLEFESMMFPADEIYGSWDTTRVNPYGKLEISYPDSFTVDCKSFVLPIDVNIKVTSNFGVRARRMHNGIDLKVQKGDTIRSAFGGKVRIRGYERRGYGNYLVIRHSNGLETVYGHLSKFLVTDNDIVAAGQAIGLGGNTGRSTGSHLHFETRFLGQALNPSHIIDFNNGGVPHHDQYILLKGNFGKNTNLYTSSLEKIVYHRVQKGETLGQIALKYRTSVTELCKLNGLTSKSVLRIGQTLRCGTTLEKTTPKAPEVKPQTESSSIIAANPKEVSSTSEDRESAALLTPESLNHDSAQESHGITYHTVKKGETLFVISQIHNTSIEDICRLNHISEKSILSIGQTLRVDDSQSSATSITSAPKIIQIEEAEPVFYRIREGDTLGAIALRHGISINQLCELNNITKTTILRIGRSLRCS
ncbi:MAG: LysM peptidoglycan-binding domain-containing protein [Tannerella sp.]|jgi:murein DD-endopeptidase MepM/ murein hydrolase activator NlpD|nr:LysM peptidoglycan-binding domain-containing protein [Tannerella sp.]